MPVKYLCGGSDGPDVTDAVLAACGEPRITVPVAEARDVREGQVQSPLAISVRIQCKEEQWCDFTCRGGDTGTVTGVPVPKDELARWKEWQKYADPLEGLKRLDRYSAWVFGAVGIVVTLASGLVGDKAPGAFNTPAAKWLFGLAVAALGLSWVFNSLSKAPGWGTLNRHSPPDYLRAFGVVLRQRRRQFAWAASLLGVSLALAALIPLAQTFKGQPNRGLVLTYTWAADLSYTASIQGDGLPPNSPIEVLIRKDGSTGVVLPVQRARTNNEGTGTATVNVPATLKLQPPFRVVARWREVHGDSTRGMADSVSFTDTGVQPAARQPTSVTLTDDSARDSVRNTERDSARDSAGPGA